jgi:hypothetical protein
MGFIRFFIVIFGSRRFRAGRSAKENNLEDNIMFKTNENGQTVNYIAAVVTGLAAFALSLLWYSPLLFGNIWMALRNAPVHPLPGWTFLFAPLREIITALLLTHLIVRLGAHNWENALGLGFVLLVFLLFRATFGGCHVG